MKFAPEHRCQCALEDAAILLVKRVQIGLRLLHFFPWMGVVDGRLTKLVETAIQVCSHDQRLALKLRNVITLQRFQRRYNEDQKTRRQAPLEQESSEGTPLIRELPEDGTLTAETWQCIMLELHRLTMLFCEVTHMVRCA